LNYINKDDDENILANCSLVITDYKMPQMSGIDFLKKMRKGYSLQDKNDAH
jgi:CheY-like chemotaxis protein